MPDANDAAAALERIAYLLEEALEPAYRVKAFRGAAATLRRTGVDEVARLHAAGKLTDLAGVGDTTARVVDEVLRGQVPAYLSQLEDERPDPATRPGAGLRARLRGDCHSHSDWSDGGSPIREMAAAARALGHEYLVLTDHSPRLTVAHGLNRERLEEQLEVVAEVNAEVAADGGPPFRLLTGIEVDIYEDGTLDQDDDLLARLDLVVASAHSKLRMEAPAMTRRLCGALANPHMDVLGHCTGRMVVGKGRPESTFDHELVFEAARSFDKAVEINCRPERLDPPRRLLRMLVDGAVKVSIDTDAHAPGQLEWQLLGCARAEETGVDPALIVNTWVADDLLAWTASHA
ncbi:MAG TPA: PHP domain-containing protein [Acidimicrobiales bacterium]|nr:PHP domain-containing protein [Acidimicrobiales bacterium]